MNIILFLIPSRTSDLPQRLVGICVTLSFTKCYCVVIDRIPVVEIVLGKQESDFPT